MNRGKINKFIVSFGKGFGETFDLKRDSDSLLAGSGLHQIEFDLVQPHGAWLFLKRVAPTHPQTEEI